MTPTSFDVSVIMPAHNRAGMIAESLSAVFAQTHPPREVIVVDDGSTDNTEAVATAFPVRYLRIRNSGPSVARKVGIEAATSPWLAFCDSDDLWRPGYLAAMRSVTSDSTNYAFSNWVIVRDGDWSTQDRFSMAPPGFFDHPEEPLYRRLFGWTPVFPSATIARRDFVLEIGGFDPRVSRLPTEDFEFLLRCNEHPFAVAQREPLVGIRRHEGNLSAGLLKAILSDIKVLGFARDHHRLGKVYRDEIDAEILRRTLDSTDLAFRAGDKRLFRELARTLPGSHRSRNFNLKVLLATPHLIPGPLLARLARI